MERLLNLKIESLKNKIKFYRYGTDEIKRIDELVKQLAEVVAGQNLIIEELQKESYKEKYREEHKKLKGLEKESREIIDNLTAELKKSERENRKLIKEIKNYEKNNKATNN